MPRIYGQLVSLHLGETQIYPELTPELRYVPDCFKELTMRPKEPTPTPTPKPKGVDKPEPKKKYYQRDPLERVVVKK